VELEITGTYVRYKMAFHDQASLLVCSFDVGMHLKQSVYRDKEVSSITYECHSNEMAGMIFACTLDRRTAERNLDGQVSNTASSPEQGNLRSTQTASKRLPN
jgi:hypothetical protein